MNLMYANEGHTELHKNPPLLHLRRPRLSMLLFAGPQKASPSRLDVIGVTTGCLCSSPERMSALQGCHPSFKQLVSFHDKKIG